MRRDEQDSKGLFSYIRLEERFADHPLQAIRVLVNEVQRHDLLRTERAPAGGK